MYKQILWMIISLVILISCNVMLTDNNPEDHTYKHSVLLEEDLLYHLGYDDELLPIDSLRSLFYADYPFHVVESFQDLSDSIQTDVIYQSVRDMEIAEVFIQEKNRTIKMFYYRRYNGLDMRGHVYTMNNWGQVIGFLEVNIW